MKTNTRINTPREHTHEGGKAARLTDMQQLRRSVMTCMLWENNFYEDGQSIADRIQDLVNKVKPIDVLNMAVEAREDFKLRHIPLFLMREMARTGKHVKVAEHLTRVIQRPDELAEFISLYWKDGKQPLSNQVKLGLSNAFYKFNEYQFGKYKGTKNAISLRDVIRLVHPKGRSSEENELFRKIAKEELATPDTWEVALSSGADKKATWTRLLSEKQLGGLALLRNLRNMQEAGVDRYLIGNALENMKVDRILPFRFITAARYAPQFEPQLEVAMLKCIAGQEKFKGKTTILLDVSGSMDWQMSTKSDMVRTDASNGLAILLRELSHDISVFTFSSRGGVAVPARHGFALRDAIQNSQEHGGTDLRSAMRDVERLDPTGERLIVLTDEQSGTAAGSLSGYKYNYMVNVANNQNGIGFGNWIRIDGWSEAIVSFIQAYERVATIKEDRY